MAYIKQVWENTPSTATPISASRLTHLETQYEEALQDSKAYTNNAIANLPPSGGGNSADLASSIRYPVYISHRGGSRVFPEHSIEGYRASADAGFTPEADVQALSDGTLVCLHDTTTNRTMNISKPIGSVTVSEWRKATINPPVNGDVFGTGKGTPVFFEDYLDEFGGRMVLWPEIKTTVPGAITAAIKAVTSRGLQKSVVIQSGVFGVCQQIVAAGCHALYLSNTATASTVKNAGIGFVGVSLTATNSYVSGLVSEGIKVIAYTANTKADADAQLARGCVGVFSDDPWEVSREFTPSTSETNLDRGWNPICASHSKENSSVSYPGGHNQKVTSENGTLVFTGGRATDPVSYPNSLRLGGFGFGLTTTSVRFWAQADTPWAVSSPENSWLAGIYFGKQADDVAVNEDPTSSVFTLAMIRRNGEKNIYERRTVGGAVTKIGTAAAPATPYAKPGGRSAPMQFEISFSPTSVTIKNLTLNDADAVASRASLTIPGSYLSFCITGANGRIWGITVS